MAVTGTHTKTFLAELYEGEHDVKAVGALTIVLMKTTFDPDTHAHEVYTDLSAHEIDAGNGYVKNDEALTNVDVDVSGANPLITCDNVSWTASGGAIETCKGACIISDLHANKTVVGYIDFGANYATGDDTMLTINFSNGLMQAEIV